MGKILSSLTGIRDIGAAVKSKVRANKMENKVVNMMNNNIGPASIIGMKNYNTQAKVIKGMVKSGKMANAKSYVNSQQSKLKKQKGY